MCGRDVVCDVEVGVEMGQGRGGAGGLMMQFSGSSVMKQHEGRDYSN